MEEHFLIEKKLKHSCPPAASGGLLWRPSFWGGASDRGPGLTASKIFQGGWCSTGREVGQENSGSSRETKDCSYRKALMLCSDSMQTEQETMPKWISKREESAVLCGPRGREAGVMQEAEGRGPPRDGNYTDPSCEWLQVTTHLSGSLSSLALPRVPQPGTNFPGEAHAPLPQTMVTKALPSHSSGLC